MLLEETYTGLDELLERIGAVGKRLVEIGAAEGAAGNLSMYIGWPLDVSALFPLVEDYTLPVAAPALAGKTVLVTGSGRRLREVGDDPQANVAAVVVGPDGLSGKLYTSSRRLFTRVTSEFNSHLAIHNVRVAHGDINFVALVHAQPLHLTYLSHIPAYREGPELNRRLYRWQPELVIYVPEGMAVLPFILPGSDPLMHATAEQMQDYRIVLWSKHGVMVRSEVSMMDAVDLLEYAEAAASYEHLNLSSGERADGLSADEIRAIARHVNVAQKIY